MAVFVVENEKKIRFLIKSVLTKKLFISSKLLYYPDSLILEIILNIKDIRSFVINYLFI